MNSEYNSPPCKRVAMTRGEVFEYACEKQHEYQAKEENYLKQMKTRENIESGTSHDNLFNFFCKNATRNMSINQVTTSVIKVQNQKYKYQ